MTATTSSSNNQDGLKTIRDVYDLLIKEIQLPTLQSIPLDTYQEIATALSRLKGQVYEGLEDVIRDRMVELISQSTTLLFERRLQKIAEQQKLTPFQQLVSSSNDSQISLTRKNIFWMQSRIIQRGRTTY